VTPGERVTSEDGTEFWLTADGKHWRQPDPDTGALTLEEFRSVVDGNLDTTEPGISMQGGGGISDGYLVSGLFYGVRSAAARVEITTFDGKAVGGTVLRLKGNTSWGVWYGEVEVPEKLKHSLDFRDPVDKVTVYGTDGEVLAEMDFGI
jgi:hypothetical protein